MPDGWLGEKFKKYQFCKTFKVSPKEYEDSLLEDVEMMLLIENEVRRRRKEDMEKDARRNR